MKIRIAGAVLIAGAAVLLVVATAGAAKKPPKIKPPSTLIKKGQISFCSDISSPPFESYTSSGKPVGEDVDLGNALAALMGIKAVWRNTAFAGIIPALQARQCDAILSGMIDKPERRAVVDFVDYLKLGNIIVVQKGNPHHVKTLDDLSGLKVAVEIGTNNKAELDAENTKLQAAGKPPMEIQAFPQDTAAFEQLVVGHVDAYFTATPTAAALVKSSGGRAQLVGKQIGSLPFGIATTKANKPLHKALVRGFARLRKNGKYLKILTKWGLRSTALK